MREQGGTAIGPAVFVSCEVLRVRGAVVGTGVIGPHASRPEFPLWIKGGKTQRKKLSLSPSQKNKFTLDLTRRGNSND